jgi:HPt (histidine-containing phosphotransfer) domain-containing protein
MHQRVAPRRAGLQACEQPGRPKSLHYFCGVWFALVLTGACAPAPATDKTPKPGAEMSRAVIDPYLKIQAALADDSMDGVKANAGNIATAATALGAPAMKIDTTAVQLAAATEIEDARDRFGALSEALDTYMTGLKLKAPEGVKVAFCPMVQKPWLQADATINNPYYGKSMQTCGSFR